MGRGFISLGLSLTGIPVLGRRGGDLRSLAPAGFGWDWAKYPIMGGKVADKWNVTTEPKSLVNPAIWSGPIYYVDPATGVDTNTGLGSYTNALQTLDKAVALGNATGAPYRVYCKAAAGGTTYIRTRGTIAISQPTQHCAIIADGGRITTGLFDNLTWALDGTYTSCYRATRTGVFRVFNLVGVDTFGNYAELTKVADAATCNSTPGSWAQEGSLVYVRRSDGAAVTNANTRALINAGCMDFSKSGTDTDVYLEGFNLEGGNTGNVKFSGGTRNFVAVDCGFRNCGSADFPVDAVMFNNTDGICALFRPIGYGGWADFINGTWSLGAPAKGRFLVVDPVGKDFGRTGNDTDNGFTLHDGLIGIVVGGLLEGNHGPNVAVVSGAQAWCAGTKTKSSNGGANTAEFQTDGTAKMWLEDTVAETSGRALHVRATSTILTRSHTTIGGGTNTVEAGGTLGTF